MQQLLVPWSTTIWKKKIHSPSSHHHSSRSSSSSYHLCKPHGQTAPLLLLCQLLRQWQQWPLQLQQRGPTQQVLGH
jgi:hypothetical protein